MTATPKNDWSRQMREANAAKRPRPVRTMEDLAAEAAAIATRLKSKRADDIVVARKDVNKPSVTHEPIDSGGEAVDNGVDNASRQAKWRQAHPELHRIRVREAAAKRRAKARSQ